MMIDIVWVPLSILEEKQKKTIFVQAIISTTCLSYEMRFQVFVRDKVFGLLSLTYAGQTLGLMPGSVSMHQLTSAENELLCSGCYDCDWMHRLLIDGLVAWLLYRFNVRLKIKWLVGRSIYWSIASSIILSVDWMISRMDDCWLMDCLNDWSID